MNPDPMSTTPAETTATQATPAPHGTPASTPRTLPLRVELIRQFTRWRTRSVLLILALLPIVIWAAFAIGSATGGRGSGQVFDTATLAQVSGINFAAYILSIAGGFLLTLVVALLFGDIIAGEASWSTLKYMLTIPIPRGRLLGQKVLVSLILLLIGLLLLSGVALGVGIIAYGAGGMQLATGQTLGFAESIGRLASATAIVGVQLLWAAALGTLLTVVTNAALAAAGGVVVVSIISSLVNAVTDLGEWRVLLPTHFSTAYRQMFSSPIDNGEIASAVLSSLTFALIFGTLAAWRFARKDIVS